MSHMRVAVNIGVSRRPRRKKRSIVLRVALVAFAIYLVYLVCSIANVYASIDSLEEETARVDAAILETELGNLELNEKAENPEIYLDEIARENGYVKPGEEHYKEIPGN